MEAYYLNKEKLKIHKTAGRLWSSFIQLTHQYWLWSVCNVDYMVLQPLLLCFIVR